MAEKAPLPTLSVMILAGGRSRRMGQDKALLPAKEGQPLLFQTLRIAWQVAPEAVIVTPWPERYCQKQPDNLAASALFSHPTVQFVQERASLKDLNGLPAAHTQGPMVGFCQGWEHIDSTWCLLLACDLPYLKASVLQCWWQHLASCDDPTIVASLVPLGNPQRNPQKDLQRELLRNPLIDSPGAQSRKPPSISAGSNLEKSWQPLCGFYHRRCLPGLNQFLAQGHRSFQKWLQTVSVKPFYDVPDSMLFNCNTPADWASVRFKGEK